MSVVRESSAVSSLPVVFPQPVSPAAPVVRPLWVAVVVLLALYAVLAIGSTLEKGVSFDEGVELALGYDIWTHGDFRMEGANGDFVKRWATLPYLVSRPALPDVRDTDWRQAHAYRLGYDFLFTSGNQPALLLLQGRFMVALLGVATGLLVFFCARGLFGALGGVFALGLYVFSPNMLAYGGMVSTEMSLCLGLLGSTWCLWRLLHRATWGRLAASLAFFSLLALAKLSCVAIAPIALVLVGVKLVFGPPLDWRLGPPRCIASRPRQLALFAGLALLHAFCGWLAVWAHYDFRYAASPVPSDSGVIVEVDPQPDPISPYSMAVLDAFRRTHLLPEGFLAGVTLLLGENDYRESFLNGQWKYGGWRSFFPYAFWAKTGPLLLSLLGVGFLVGLWRVLRVYVPALQAAAAPDPGFRSSAYALVPYLALILVYFAIAVVQDLDIGHRHILPVYPPCYVLAGGAAVWLWSRRGSLLKVLILLLFALKIFSTLWLYPNYLAYFNPLIGGPAQGYKHLVDSSLGWGMELPSLKRWLDQHDPGNRQPVFLAYFGADSPDYHGIRARRLPGYFDWRPHVAYPLEPGLYVISATLLQGVGSPAFGPWNQVFENQYQKDLHNLQIWDSTAHSPDQRALLLQKFSQSFWDKTYADFEALRFGRLCAWLRHHRAPDANIGYSLLIWDLSFADLHDALLGPPAELAPRPLTPGSSGSP